MHTPKLGWAPDALAHKLGISFEDAQAINRALNSHDKLLEAVEKILAEVGGRLGKGPSSAASSTFIREQAFVAIREAKGE